MAVRKKPGITLDYSGTPRCWWCGSDPVYQEYHDQEWGRPVDDDHRLFEKVSLEGFQSGLSWLTILKKRDNFRRAFKDFDYRKVARFREKHVERLLQDAGIVRHRGKIESVINNAKRALEMVDEFGSLAAYFWEHEPPAAARPRRITHAKLLTLNQTEESRALSKDLKKRGWSYVGPTTLYAFMQAMGMVNDHLEACSFRTKVEKDRERFRRPTA